MKMQCVFCDLKLNLEVLNKFLAWKGEKNILLCGPVSTPTYL